MKSSSLKLRVFIIQPVIIYDHLMTRVGDVENYSGDARFGEPSDANESVFEE